MVLTRADVAGLLTLDDCMEAVEQAFRAHGLGRARPPGALGHPTVDGGFHVKMASLDLDRPYFAVKTNGNFFRNGERFGLPRIQGVIVLCDAENGTALAVMDSMEITIQRTGAATGVAARYLARRDASVATIVGCGLQGRVQLQALSRARALSRVMVCDTDPGLAASMARELSPALGVEIQPVTDLPAATRQSDLVVTCTPSRRAILGRSDVKPGTFVAAVGADSEDKQEIAADLLASSAVVVDILDQCATFGDLRHAIAAGAMRREDVRAELGEVVAGTKQGRVSDQETIVFDSTGTALQDVAAAAMVYQRAVQSGAGHRVHLGS
ncbi:MAG TPA: ornithine cyclodeaminase family protein [Gemmatimonadales bacterium]